MADAPFAYGKLAREWFSENPQPSACQRHSSIPFITTRPLAMVWSSPRHTILVATFARAMALPAAAGWWVYDGSSAR